MAPEQERDAKTSSESQAASHAQQAEPTDGVATETADSGALAVRLGQILGLSLVSARIVLVQLLPSIDAQ